MNQPYAIEQRVWCFWGGVQWVEAVVRGYWGESGLFTVQWVQYGGTCEYNVRDAGITVLTPEEYAAMLLTR